MKLNENIIEQFYETSGRILCDRKPNGEYPTVVQADYRAIMIMMQKNQRITRELLLPLVGENRRPEIVEAY